MTVRHYQSGDEVAQAEVYNVAAAKLPGFRPAQAEEIRRRLSGRDFDPTSRFYLEVGGRVVGYVGLHASGRVSYPWCRPNYEAGAEELWQALVTAARARGVGQLWAAYRADWPIVADFFPAHGLPKARDVHNYILELLNLPTLVTRPALAITEFQPADVPALRKLGPGVFRVDNAELERHLFANPFFEPRSLIALRRRDDHTLRAVALLIEDASYADPEQLAPAAPEFRHGAFGTEGLPTRRVNGLFSLAAPCGSEVLTLGLDLLGVAVGRVDDTLVSTLAAQATSDAPHLLQFYDRFFRRQGSFPMFEGPAA